MTTAFTRTLRLTALAAALSACSTEKQSGGTGSDSLAATPVATPGTAAPMVIDSAAGSVTVATGGLLDPGSATKEQLAAVPGMTAAAAEALVAGRPYADMTAADKALASAGIDVNTREQLYAHVWRPIDLNTASKTEILLIPGVGNRMLREFEEYRPYKDLRQFEREIGKYVDTEELARLKRYVALR